MDGEEYVVHSARDAAGNLEEASIEFGVTWTDIA